VRRRWRTSATWACGCGSTMSGAWWPPCRICSVSARRYTHPSAGEAPAPSPAPV